jgi:3-hydroxyacyl-CoA dehydrogenase/enoyl-CoA hydratase/3-hydroxybutyryl-CoA epimerase
LFFDFARTEVSPFLGGPMHYAHARGMIEVMRTLEQLAKKYDERVRLDQSWNQLK